MDVSIPRGPQILQQGLGKCFSERRGAVAEQVQRGAQGTTPRLTESGLAAVAATVRPPTLHPVRATPGGIVHYLGFPYGRETGKELAIVGEGCQALFLDPVQRVA